MQVRLDPIKSDHVAPVLDLSELIKVTFLLLCSMSNNLRQQLLKLLVQGQQNAR